MAPSQRRGVNELIIQGPHGTDTGYSLPAADRIYAQVPDLGGFVLKADSEGRLGPSAYKRTHADAANVIARALAPHGGVLFYRGFVYDNRMDWRNLKNDRARAAVDNFRTLDGSFDANVFRVLANTQFSPWLSLGNNIQYDSVSKGLGWQLRFRWIERPGNDLFFVYIHNWREVVTPADRHFATLDNRAATKLVYTWRF